MNVGELAQDVMAELTAGRELPNTQIDPEKTTTANGLIRVIR
jgi:hypothetical protein